MKWLNIRTLYIGIGTANEYYKKQYWEECEYFRTENYFLKIYFPKVILTTMESVEDYKNQTKKPMFTSFEQQISPRMQENYVAIL